MDSYVVLYRDDSLLPADPPLAFVCQADDVEHAEEQCENAYHDAEIVWVVQQTDDVQFALFNYYNYDQLVNGA